MKNLEKRKALASRVLRAGVNKIFFEPSRLDEIKEAITKQDIRDLYESGAIKVKEKVGRLRKEHRTTKRGVGKVKKKVQFRKRDYMRRVRKLRRHISELRKQKKLNQENYRGLRIKIKANMFKDKAHLKDYIGGIKS